uniref:Uncharacterized protein n=1 Tax=Anopheles darlingi TaxID=43151 RepID=A0A2M4DG16_ANODA
MCLCGRCYFMRFLISLRLGIARYCCMLSSLALVPSASPPAISILITSFHSLAHSSILIACNARFAGTSTASNNRRTG